ncbi:MAG: MFS transporter [Microbacteriaceae bacterium]
MVRLPRAIKPLGNGQYRILVLAITMGLFGSGIWAVASIWQIIRMGGDELDVSYVATAVALGLVLTALLGGVAADRIPQKYILVVTEGIKTAAIILIAVLALTGGLEIWHLVLVGFFLGAADGFFYPAYTAMLPSILPPEELQAANGLEGMLRPTILQALGPALAAMAIAAYNPPIAIALVGFTQLLALLGLSFLRKTDVRRDFDAVKIHPLKAMVIDIRDGFGYLVRTKWLLGTLLFSCLMVLLMMGPIEVLLPFAIRDQTGGDADAHAAVLVAFGVGSILGALVAASITLPRRYLTFMTLGWALGCLPIAVVGLTDQLWVMMVAVFTCGFAFSIGGVIWGTLLQRRVPSAMLGRVASLDFFVSLALMPVSMALAGPLGALFGNGWMFAMAGIVPVILGVLTVLLFGFTKDELENPLSLEPLDMDVENTPILNTIAELKAPGLDIEPLNHENS